MEKIVIRLFAFLLLVPFNAFADTSDGIKHYRAENYEQAYNSLFATVQEQEDAEAYYWLGIMYQKGQFVEQHDYTALLYFEKAGYLKHVEAMREAIRYHLNGWGTIPNRALAAFWLKMSAYNDPQYASLFKRFYGRLTTFERLEYEKRIENYQDQP